MRSILLLLCIFSLAEAQDLAGWDSDGDGRVQRAEFLGPAALFERLDRDGDGVLAGREMLPLDAVGEEREDPKLAKARRKLQRQFASADEDQDGRLAEGELRKNLQLDWLDGDGDALLTFSEFLCAQLNAPAHGVLLREACDEDADGWLAREEWPASVAAFAALDADADGRLGPGELLIAYGRKLIKMLDNDGDRLLGPHEWRDDLPAFARIDSNADGLVDALEAACLP